MKGDWKIPFKKLEWHSGVTEEGEKLGFVHQIGEFYAHEQYPVTTGDSFKLVVSGTFNKQKYQV